MKPLAELGVDSLMGVELRIAAEERLGVDILLMSIGGAGSIADWPKVSRAAKGRRSKAKKRRTAILQEKCKAASSQFVSSLVQGCAALVQTRGFQCRLLRSRPACRRLRAVVTAPCLGRKVAHARRTKNAPGVLCDKDGSRQATTRSCARPRDGRRTPASWPRRCFAVDDQWSCPCKTSSAPMLCNGVLKAWPVDQTALSLSARSVRDDGPR